MTLELAQGHCLTHPGHLIRVNNALGCVLRCKRGTVWITQHHDLRDVILQAGESFKFDRRGTALVQGLDGGAIEITRPKHVRRQLFSFLLPLLNRKREVDYGEGLGPLAPYPM